ncbi:MAG TPA: helix-turn-helix domain-containing protein [Victivallales bacterium]|nr:helix-turn-helix domain-containing protein [Victivallales bacterium]
MEFQYSLKPDIVKKVFYVSHKGRTGVDVTEEHTHRRFYHEFIYVDYGTMQIYFGKRKLLLKPGECIFIPGLSSHSMRGDAGMSYDYFNLMFSGKLPADIFKKPMKAGQRALYLIGQLRQESIAPQAYGNQAVAGLLMMLIVELLRQATNSVSKHLPESPNVWKYPSEYVNRAMKIIEQDYSKQLTLNQVSRSSGIGYSRLCKLLKEQTGENFCSILHRKRVSSAKYLLREKGLSIEEIAEKVGYKDASFFFKVFKRISGMTPLEYARSLGDPLVCFPAKSPDSSPETQKRKNLI